MTAKRSASLKNRSKTKAQTRITTKQRKQRRKNARRVIVLVALVCLVVSVLYLLNMSQLRLDSVQVKGVANLDAQTVEKNIQEKLSGKNWLIFPRDSIFWYGKNELNQWLLAQYPEIDSLEIDMQKFDLLQVTIQERKEKYHANVSNVLYDVDSEGVLFKKSDTEETITRIFYSNLSTSTPQLGDHFVESQYFKDFNLFLDGLSQRGIQVEKILFENKIQTVLQLPGGVRIVIHPSDNLDSVSSTLQEILPYKEFGYDRKTGLFANKLAYINFRYGNKLFYCYQGDVCADNYLIK